MQTPSSPRALRLGSILLVFSLLAQSAVLPNSLPAQISSRADESAGESIELSPFVVSSAEDRGYARSSGPRFQPGSASVPTVPITLVRAADAVVIEFALSNNAAKQDLRNKELTESVELIAKAIKEIPGVRFENREVQLSTASKWGSLIGRGESVTSFANFAVFADLSAEVRLYERVKQIRGLVSAAKLVGGTKVMDGPVALFVKRPNDSRSELLARIFADLETVKKGLGADFEVLVSGLSGPVQLRSCSESEVELWLDYSFSIRSLREMESKRPVKA